MDTSEHIFIKVHNLNLHCQNYNFLNFETCKPNRRHLSNDKALFDNNDLKITSHLNIFDLIRIL